MRTVTLPIVILFVALQAQAGDTNLIEKAVVRQMLVQNAQAEAVVSVELVQQIRRGKTNAVSEVLESRIDNVIVSVGSSLKKLDPAAKRSAIEFLKEMKVYRSKYPRKIDATIYGSKEHLDAAAETTEKAKQILSKRE